jgi:hypothetical protein
MSSTKNREGWRLKIAQSNVHVYLAGTCRAIASEKYGVDYDEHFLWD